MQKPVQRSGVHTIVDGVKTVPVALAELLLELLDQVLTAVSAVKVPCQIPTVTVPHFLVPMLTERLAPLFFPLGL